MPIRQARSLWYNLAMVSASDIKVLRDETGLSMSLVKSALDEAGGDKAKALEILRSKAGAAAEKKSGRALGAGTVASYVHSTKTMGAMVELDSETDFVAKNDEFKQLAYDIAMHVSATAPADVPALMEEAFVKDGTRTIKQLIEGAVQKFGERVEIKRFSRFSVLD